MQIQHSTLIRIGRNKNMTITENKSNSASDEVAYYEVMHDTYAQKHKFRFKCFKKILKHMERHIGESATIWILMQEVRKNRN